MHDTIILDLDGTLLNSQNQLSDYTKDTLQLLIKEGLTLIFATGRHYLDVKKFFCQINALLSTITSNGACIHNTSGKQTVDFNLNNDISLEIIDLISKELKVITNIYQHSTWLTNRLARLKRMDLFKETNLRYTEYHRNTSNLTRINKIFFLCNDHDLLSNVEKKLTSIWANKINVSFSTLNCLEVVAAGVSKGDALKHIGCDLKNCIAFGDGMNDKEMLSMVDKGCIVENGQEELKSHCKDLEIVGPNTEDGVARYLRKIYL